MHRLRLRLRDAQKMLESNRDACQAMMDHIDNCKNCVGNLMCPDSVPFYEAFMKAKMLSRLYFGEEASISLGDDYPTPLQ